MRLDQRKEFSDIVVLTSPENLKLTKQLSHAVIDSARSPLF